MAKNKVAGVYLELAAGIAKFTGPMEQAANSLGSIQRRMQQSFKAIQIGAGLALGAAAVLSIRKFSDELSKLADKGEVAASIGEGFKRLGGSTAEITRAQSAVMGMVDSFDLMAIANKGLLSGLPGFSKNFSQIADLGARVADTLGIDTKAGIEQVTDALISGKEKQLEAIGFTVDADRAYQEYAKTLGVSADHLDETAKRSAIVAQAMSQLSSVTGTLAPVTDSVANATEAFGSNLSEAVTEIGIAINENESLTAGIRSLADALNSIDWQGVAAGLDNIISKMTSLTQLVTGDNFGARLAAQFRMMFEDSPVANLARLGKEMARVQNLMEHNEGETLRQFGGQRKAQSYLSEKKAEYDALLSSIIATKKAADQTGQSLSVGGNLKESSTLFGPGTNEGLRVAREAQTALKNAGQAAIGATGKIEGLAAKWREFASDVANDDIKGQIENAISVQDSDSFDRLKEEFRKATVDGILEGRKAEFDAAGLNLEQARRIAEKKADMEVGVWQERWDDSVEQSAEALQSRLEDSLRNAADFWEDTFDKAFEEGTTSWEEDLTDLAKGFGTELATQLSGGMDQGLGDGAKGLGKILANLFGGGSEGSSGSANFELPKGAGKEIWQSIVDMFSGGNGTSATDVGGTSNATDNALADLFGGGGPQGVQSNADGSIGMSDGSSDFSGAQSSGTATSPGNTGGPFSSAGGSEYIGPIIAAFKAKDIDKQNKDNSGTGAAVGSAIGAYFGGPLGAKIGEIIGKFAGSLMKWGSQDLQTQLRHQFSNYVEEGFEKLKQVSFFNDAGKLESIAGEQFNFVEGSNNRFNIGETVNWADKLNSMASKTRGTFIGLGEAIRGAMGVEEELGSQFGFLMAENFKTIDNARLFVQQFGLDLEDTVSKFVELGRSGEQSWLEVQIAIDGVTEAFKPGLEAIGDAQGALDQLVQSGGRGVAALKGLKDVAVETIEAGGKTLEDMRRILLAQGATPEYVDALMQAATQRGITSLEDLANASDQLAGSVVADMNTISAGLASEWEKMEDQLKGINEQLSEIPEEVDINLKVNAQLSDSAQKVLDSEIGQRAGLSNLSSSALGNNSATLSLGTNPSGNNAGNVRSLSNMGTSDQPMTIIVQAPGAEAGVEKSIESMMRGLEERVVRRAVNSITSASRGR